MIPGVDAIPTNRPRKSFPSRTLTISAVLVLIWAIPVVTLFYERTKDKRTQSVAPTELSLNNFEQTVLWVDGVLSSLNEEVSSEQQLLGKKDKLAKRSEELLTEWEKYKPAFPRWKLDPGIPYVGLSL